MAVIESSRWKKIASPEDRSARGQSGRTGIRTSDDLDRLARGQTGRTAKRTSDDLDNLVQQVRPSGEDRVQQVCPSGEDPALAETTAAGLDGPGRQGEGG